MKNMNSTLNGHDDALSHTNVWSIMA